MYDSNDALASKRRWKKVVSWNTRAADGDPMESSQPLDSMVAGDRTGQGRPACRHGDFQSPTLQLKAQSPITCFSENTTALATHRSQAREQHPDIILDVTPDSSSSISRYACANRLRTAMSCLQGTAGALSRTPFGACPAASPIYSRFRSVASYRKRSATNPSRSSPSV